MTITQPLILDVGPKEFANGLTYTGSSRTPDFTNLAFEPLPSFNRILSIFTRARFKEKETEIGHRLETIAARGTGVRAGAGGRPQELVEERGGDAVEDDEELVLSQLSNITI